MKKIFGILVLLCAVQAKASFMAEPYLGYTSGDVKATFAAGLPVIGGTSANASASGVTYGVRLGYEFLLPWVAFDYTGGSLTSSGNSASLTAMGVTVGASLPMLRPYVGYGFDEKLGDAAGTYTKLGVGFGFIPLVYLNLEYAMHNFTKLNGNDISSTYSDYKMNTISVSVSKAFSF